MIWLEPSLLEEKEILLPNYKNGYIFLNIKIILSKIYNFLYQNFHIFSNVAL